MIFRAPRLLLRVSYDALSNASIANTIGPSLSLIMKQIIKGLPDHWNSLGLPFPQMVWAQRDSTGDKELALHVANHV